MRIIKSSIKTIKEQLLFEYNASKTVYVCVHVCDFVYNQKKHAENTLQQRYWKEKALTMGRYPAPVVAAIGCGDQPPAGPPVFAAFFGEFHCIPLQKKSTRQFVVTLQSAVSILMLSLKLFINLSLSSQVFYCRKIYITELSLSLINKNVITLT